MHPSYYGARPPGQAYTPQQVYQMQQAQQMYQMRTQQQQLYQMQHAQQATAAQMPIPHAQPPLHAQNPVPRPPRAPQPRAPPANAPGAPAVPGDPVQLPPWAPADAAELAYYESLFLAADPQRKGWVDGKAAFDLMSRSRLSRDALRQIWALADSSKRGALARPNAHHAHPHITSHMHPWIIGTTWLHHLACAARAQKHEEQRRVCSPESWVSQQCQPA